MEKPQKKSPTPARHLLPLDPWSGAFEATFDNEGVESSLGIKTTGLIFDDDAVEIGGYFDQDWDDDRPTFGGRVKWTF